MRLSTKQIASPTLSGYNRTSFYTTLNFTKVIDTDTKQGGSRIIKGAGLMMNCYRCAP
jgi:hypothetical protein